VRNAAVESALLEPPGGGQSSWPTMCPILRIDVLPPYGNLTPQAANTASSHEIPQTATNCSPVSGATSVRSAQRGKWGPPGKGRRKKHIQFGELVLQGSGRYGNDELRGD